ncbi:uncharacterized protein [Ptychodera flava]|uniref:uncharacterized protein n=1 Tax=Ptychodera flava TaxID=63121 RepID=UPI00396A5C60
MADSKFLFPQVHGTPCSEITNHLGNSPSPLERACDPYDFEDTEVRYFDMDYASPRAVKSTKRRRVTSTSATSDGSSDCSPDWSNSSFCSDDAKPCGCKNMCRTSHCRCVRLNGACTDACRCKICFNPSNKLQILEQYGLDVDECTRDVCLMEALPKLTDEQLRRVLGTHLQMSCCGLSAFIFELVPGKRPCPNHHCDDVYAYSWCDDNVLPLSIGCRRNHCSKCRRCVGRNQRHCNKCKHCCMAPCACHMQRVRVKKPSGNTRRW